MKLKNTDNKQPKSCLDVVSKTFKDFAENTSIHGLKYTVKKEVGYREKLFWVIIILAGFMGAIYMTVLFWDRYTSNPMRTTILTTYAPTTTTPFPAITLCNINRILVSKLKIFIKKLDVDKQQSEVLERALPQLLAFSYPNMVDYNMTELNLLQDILESKDTYHPSDLMRELGQTCDDMLVYCAWNNKPIDCSNNFVESLAVDGYCCSFNYMSLKQGKPIYNAYSGKGSGLTVILDSMIQKPQYSSLLASGYKVVVHNSLEYPGAQADTKIIAKNKISYLQIIGTKLQCSESVKNLPIKQRHCLYPNEMKLAFFKEKYSVSNCLTECDASYYYEQCECIPFYFKFAGKPICNITAIPCLHKAKRNDTGTRKCQCMNQCEDNFFSLITSKVEIEPDKLSMVMLPFNATLLKPGYTVINAYHMKQTQTIYLRDTITSTLYLLSSFGGVYSLFMGCSLITIFEILYYCFFRFPVNLKRYGRVAEDNKKKETKIMRVSTVQTNNLNNEWQYRTIFVK